MSFAQSFRSGVKGISPPILSDFLRRKFTVQPGEVLFDGEAALFQRLLKDCKVYGEYGCGKSTAYVAENSAAEILSVDSSKVWTDKVRAALPDSRDASIEYVDCGPLGDWGRPLDYTRRDSFQRYTDFLWSGERHPDLVLVDGRFRVACFLTSLQKAEPGSVILFDDYRDRPHYHLVEEFVEPFDECGRQFAFRVPADLDRDRLAGEIERFRYVLD